MFAGGFMMNPNGLEYGSRALVRINPQNYVIQRGAGPFSLPLRFDPVVRMYRSVDSRELADIEAIRGFRPSLGSYEGKLFAPTSRHAATESRGLYQHDMRELHRMFPDASPAEISRVFGPDYARSIIEARLRESLFRQFGQFHCSDYNANAINVDPSQFGALNSGLIGWQTLPYSPLP